LMRKNGIFFPIKFFDNFFADNLFINLIRREKILVFIVLFDWMQKKVH
jgi:hypothetical protein